MEGADVPFDPEPIASCERAGGRGGKGYQCQLTMGTLQAQLVLWREATDTQEFDGRADVDASRGLPERAE